jgi:outer membrane protein assembly factor BamB
MLTRRRNILALVVLAGLCLGADWTRFRGPNGQALSTDAGLPTEWTETKNVVWRTKLPGPGSSSPITLGNRIFLTCYSGYGVGDDEGDMNDLRRHVVCVDRKSGQILWDKQFKPELPEQKYGGYIALHGYASSTPATDGKHVYVFLGKSGVYCLDLDGNVVWHKSVGTRTHGWGSATSPILYKDLVIVNASVESGAMVALDKGSGEDRWRATGMSNSWNTPILVNVPKGQTELVFAASNKMIGLDPETGKELWFADVYDWYVCPSLVSHEGVAYGLQHSIAVAVRCGGRGDVTETHTLWKENVGAVVSSCVYHDGNIHWMRDGACFCLDAATGKQKHRQGAKPGAGTVYASPVVADGTIYYVSQRNGIYVIAAGDTFEHLAHNVFADDKSRTNASPVVSDGRLLVRTDEYLYCIGK